MHFLALLGLAAAVLPTCNALCPSSSKAFYLQTNGLYAVTTSATDEPGPPYGQNFNVKSIEDATKYSFFRNAKHQCQLTYAGTVTKGHPNANQSLSLYSKTDGGPAPNTLAAVYIAPGNIDADSSYEAAADILCQVAKSQHLSCSVTYPDGAVYNIFSLLTAPDNTLLISNTTGSGQVQVKVIPA